MLQEIRQLRDRAKNTESDQTKLHLLSSQCADQMQMISYYQNNQAVNAPKIDPQLQKELLTHLTAHFSSESRLIPQLDRLSKDLAKHLSNSTEALRLSEICKQRTYIQ